MIFGLENVRFDEDSKVGFEELCEIEYLEGIFKHLQVEMGADFDAHDFVVYSANNTKGPKAPPNPEQTILLYISDETMRIPEHLSPHFKAIFKCYIPVDRQDNIFSLPLGYVAGRKQFEQTPIESRPFNVFFSGNLNENRFPLYQHFNWFKLMPTWIFTRLYYRVKNKLKFDYSNYFPQSYINFTHGFNTGLNAEQYTHYLYNSKIIICPKGFTSAETFRHYEALQAGGVILSEKLPDTYYYKNGPFVQLSSWREMDKVVKELLANPEKLKEKQAQAKKWWEDVCSEKAVAAYIKRSIEKL